MTIDAIDGHRCARFAIQIPVAVVVLRPVTIDAVHAEFEVNVLEMDRRAVLGTRHVDDAAGRVLVLQGRLARRRIVQRLGVHGRAIDYIAVGVEQIAVAVLFVDGAKDPAMPVEIGELRVQQLRVDLLVEIFKEVRPGHVADLVVVVGISIGPQSSHRRAFGIVLADLVLVFAGRILLLARIHELAVGLVVPPGVSEIRVQHVRARVNVTDDARARRHVFDERVLHRMPGFVLRNLRIVLHRRAAVARLCPETAVHRAGVVGVDDVTGAASAGAIVAGMIVRAHHVQRGIEQAGFLQADPDRIGSHVRAKAAIG